MNNSGKQIYGKVIANRPLIDNHYLMSITLNEPILKPLPGQFIMLLMGGREGTFLGRPFSVYRIECRGKKTNIEILYRAVGKGTSVMSTLKPGEMLRILGPRGKGFDFFPKATHIIMIAGGVGIAPMSYLASFLRESQDGNEKKFSCYVGAKTADHILGLDNLETICSSVNISTDDGSAGYHGMITERFEQDLASFQPDKSIIYACGPTPMLKKLSEILNERLISCQILLEQRMACGIGACLGCVVQVKDQNGESPYRRVCKEGPVFDIKDIAWQ